MNGYKSARAREMRARGYLAGEDYILSERMGRCSRAREILSTTAHAYSVNGRIQWCDMHGRRVPQEYCAGMFHAAREFLRDFNAA